MLDEFERAAEHAPANRAPPSAEPSLTKVRPSLVQSLATVTGSIGDKEGSFVLQDVGTFENGVAKGRWTILPGLGSGAFANIRGDGHFAALHENASYYLEVNL